MSNDPFREAEEIVSVISQDMDALVTRWKRLGKTFDLPYVLKLVAAKHAARMYDDALTKVYFADFDEVEVSKLKGRAVNRSMLFEQMIKAETE